MKNSARFLLAALVSALLVGNVHAAQETKKDTPAAILDDMLKLLNDARVAFEGIKDAKTATTAEKKIDTVIAGMDKVAARAEKIKGQSLSKEDAKKYKAKFDEFFKKFQAGLAGASKEPKGRDALMKFSLKLQTVGKKLSDSGIVPKE